MRMTLKERLWRALQHEPMDRIPTQINYTPSMGARLSAHFGVAPAELPRRLGNHLLRLDLHFPEDSREDEQVHYDGWGVGWSKETEGYWPVVSPLAESENLDDYPWPDPDAPDLLKQAARVAVQDDGPYFLAPNFGFALYERAWSLRGFEKFNMDLALNPGFAADLLEHITEIQCRLAQRCLDLPVDGGYFGDDYGAQKHMLLSPRVWRQMFKPRLAKMFAVFREANLPVILHSDGDIAQILPDLVEIGLTALNPVQPEVLDLQWLSREFGGRLAFYGGVSTQSVLPHGGPDEVRAAAQLAVARLAPDGTGLLLAPSHRLTADIPVENVEALVAYFGELGSER